jgi:hypothetical protein
MRYSYGKYNNHELRQEAVAGDRNNMQLWAEPNEWMPDETAIGNDVVDTTSEEIVQWLRTRGYMPDSEPDDAANENNDENNDEIEDEKTMKKTMMDKLNLFCGCANALMVCRCRPQCLLQYWI